MADWNEAQDGTEHELTSDAGQEPLTPAGQSAMRGEQVDLPQPPVEAPDEDVGLISTHHPQHPEILENKEIEPETVAIEREGKFGVPPDWKPGGVEGGG